MTSATMDVPIDQLRALPLEKRLEIIEALWDSVESECGSEGIPEEFAGVLERRYPEHVADPASSLSWEQVRNEIRRQLQQARNQDGLRQVLLSESEQAEFDRRLAEHRRNPGVAKPVDTFLDELDRRYA